MKRTNNPAIRSEFAGSATEIRTPVPALKGLCPGPLDDGAADSSLPLMGIRTPVRMRQDGDTNDNFRPLARECDCPEWVVRCVHFGERWLINHGHPQIPSEGSTWVCSGTGTGPAQDIGQHAAHQLFATEADALAAFYAAERELLERAE